MTASPPSAQKPAWLFWGAISAAAILAGMVVAAPFLIGVGAWASLRDASIISRVLSLFAFDPAVRRASAVASLGLGVTAFVFFRGSRPAIRDDGRSTRVPPGGKVVGA